MLLEPSAKAMIRHKLSELAKLTVEWLAINSNAMANDISDWVISRFAVHAGFRLTRKSSAAATGSVADNFLNCFNHDKM